MPRRRLVVRLANLWRENPRPAADLGLLLRDRMAHVVAINEGANHTEEIRAAAERHAYRFSVGDTGDRLRRQNPILVRNDLRVLDAGTKVMCDAVGASPARSASWVVYRFGDDRMCHINTHANSHVQEGHGPHELPRVTQYIQHMKRLSRLVKAARDEGYTVTVSGDLNWSYTARVVGWYWNPRNTFGRLGMRVQWAGRDATGPSHGRRRIDYLAHHPRDLTIVEQRILDGRSDHGYPEVNYITKERP